TQEERANMDRALVDLRVINKSRTADGKWEITAQRTNQSASKIKEGDLVLASDGDPITGDHELGRVEQLTSQRILITAPEPIELQRVDVYPSELSINRMHVALHDFLLTGNERRRNIFFHDKEPTFSGTADEIIPNNDAQNRAVQKALRADDFALIHGPPGTGKTYTIAKLIQELVSNDNRVLLSAFTNRAVDNALDALRSQGYEDVLRVGTKTGIRGDMHDLHLTAEGSLSEMKEKFTKTPVVAATTASCGSRTMREQEFDIAIIDEASQLTEPDTLTAINRAEKFVLVGDHKQLPPVVRSENMNQSLFERLIDLFPETAVMLNQQYRMAQQIQAFSSREFYDNNLRPANTEIATQRLTDMDINTHELPAAASQQVSFVHVDGDTQRNSDTNEAQKIATIIDELTHAGIPENEIGVIAPYRAQVSEISSRLSGDITVDTVDRFQGSSKEIIIVSFVATGSLDGVIFEDYRRLNVALTRARKSLILVGDENALRSDDLYERMIEWATIQKPDID
ncbi:MAG: AAA domain-containing protein, partial [Halobacteriaceae archaeon]